MTTNSYLVVRNLECVFGVKIKLNLLSINKTKLLKLH